MQVVIPVAGAVYRRSPYADAQPKALMPLAGSTILGHVIAQFRHMGLHDFIFIVGHMGDRIEEYVREKHSDISMHFVRQSERLGIAHAIHLTENLIAGKPFIIALGDTICELDAQRFLRADENLVCVQRVDNPSSFGVVVLDEHQPERVVQVVEKPTIPTSNLALVGIYKIYATDVLFAYLNKSAAAGKMSRKNNYSITYALEGLLSEQIPLSCMRVHNWFDCGSKDHLLRSNAILLRKMYERAAAPTEKPNVRNSVLIPPLSIPASCVIENAVLGPNVTFGEHTSVQGAVIENSIVGAHSTIAHVLLRDSVIGSNTHVSSRANIFDIGDDTQIQI